MLLPGEVKRETSKWRWHVNEAFKNWWCAGHGVTLRLLERTGNVVSNLVITVYGAHGVLEILRETLYKVYECQTTKSYI